MPKWLWGFVRRQPGDRDDLDVRQLIPPVQAKRHCPHGRKLVGLRMFADWTTGRHAMIDLYFGRAKPIPVNVSAEANKEQECRASQECLLPNHNERFRRAVFTSSVMFLNAFQSITYSWPSQVAQTTGGGQKWLEESNEKLAAKGA
jgi:hypothetical protein